MRRGQLNTWEFAKTGAPTKTQAYLIMRPPKKGLLSVQNPPPETNNLSVGAKILQACELMLKLRLDRIRVSAMARSCLKFQQCSKEHWKT